MNPRPMEMRGPLLPKLLHETIGPDVPQPFWSLNIPEIPPSRVTENAQWGRPIVDACIAAGHAGEVPRIEVPSGARVGSARADGRP
jgi:hypothetical protein